MKEELYGERVASGLIDGKHFEGIIIQQPFGFLASVHEVPQPGEQARFTEHISQICNTIEEAREFVKTEWNKRQTLNQ